MSNCKIFRNRDKSINKVMDEFGNESQLYQDTLFHVSTLVDKLPLTPPIKHYLDKGDIMDTSVSEVALGLWAYSYSKHFRDKYNITKSNLEEVSVDDIIRHIEEYYPKPVTATPTVVQQEVKEGVEDLFESNPELDGSKLSEVEGKLEANKDRLIELLGSSMYSEKLKDVVYKELLQNAFDATKIAESKGLIDKGKIDIEINEKERIISFTDNGIGMTSNIVQKAFFTIGGTYKGDDVDNKLKSGGLGLAKMAFIFGSEKLILETVHNGIKTTVNATSQEIRNDNFKIKSEQTNEKNGTKVSVKIPKTYVDSKGENRLIDFPTYIDSEFKFSFLKNPLLGNVDINYSIKDRDSNYRKDETTKTNLGKLPEGFILFSPAKTSFADMDIYIDTKNEIEEYRSPSHSILSSGLFQFDFSFKTQNDESIPLNIIIDIKPKVDATNSQYPFNNQRENFKPTVKSDINALNAYLALLWKSIEIELLKNSFSKIKNIDAVDINNIDSNIIEANRNITKNFISSSNSEIILKAVEDFTKKNEEATIEAGRLNTKALSLSKEDIDKEAEKAYSRTFKADKEISINRNSGVNLDSNKPIIHNNTNMNIDSESTRFLSEVSSIMIEYKKSIIDFYGEDYSPNIKEQLWGVSIDKEYGGVNVNPSFLNMLAINPFYNFPTNPKVDAVNYIAVALDHLIIHELNHNFERNEGAGFTGRFLTTYSEIHSLPNHFELMLKLKLTIKNNLQTIKKLNYEYEQSKNVESGFKGNRIEDNNQTRADNGINSISENDSSRNERTTNNDTRSSEKFGEIINSNILEGKKFVSSNVIPEQRVEQITNIINSELPFEIANAVIVVEDVPLDILGNTDLYLSMKDILEEKGITDPFLVNWLGINKTGFGNFSGIYSEQHLQKIVESNYNRKLKDDNPILKDKNIKENFDKWVAALENYPIVFKDLMLKHAIKNLNKDRRNKYILQLSPIALQQTYGLAVNKPHELNRIGKLYDQEVLKTVSDAIGHEVSASGNGYWVHIPRTTLSQYRIVAEFINDTYGNKYVKKFFNIEELFTYAKQTDEIYQIIGEEDEIDKEDNSEELKKNVELIRKLSPSTWCTATYMAEEYVKNYDNYLLIVNGVTVVGVEVYPQEEKYKLDLEPITKEKYDEAVETSYKNSNDVIGEFTEDGEVYYVDINDKIRYKRDNSGYYKESASVDLENVPKRKVNEVTSRNNNGMASIDHLDDTIAFFEKHNLDLNNSSLNRAISKKEKGSDDSTEFTEDAFEMMVMNAPEGVDIDLTYEEYLHYLELQRDQEERNAIDRFNGEYEFDPPDLYLDVANDEYLEMQRLYEDEYREYEILINTKRNEAVNINTVEEAINFIDTFNFIDRDAFVTVIGLNRNLLDNEQVANKIVETNAYGIEYIDNRLPFYRELAHKALTINANVYDKLSYETQLEQRNIDLIRRYNDINENSREEANDLPFSKNNTKLIQGYYNPKTDEVVVVANNISTNEASKVAIHEVAHRGIIRMAKELGGARELNKILFNAEKQLMKKLPELLKRTGHKTLEDLVRDYGFNIRTEDGKAKLLAELAARWSETLINKPKPSWWKKFITDIKNWITKFTGKILNEEEVNELIGGFVRYGTENIKETPTYNPETKSKTELLDEFNKLIEVSEKMGTKYPDDAINKIKSFLQDLNFNLSTVDEVLAKRGLKDNPKAVIDFAYNTIAFGDGATVEDFAEEIGHLIALHAPQDKNLDRALEAIKDTQLYKDNYLNYVKTYSKPGLALEMSPQRKAALEVLGRFYGKLLTGTLTENDMKISKQSVFRRIMNGIRNMINGNFNLRNYLEKNRDNFFLEPGKDIKSQEIFYSLDNSEKITYSKMTNAIDKMAKSLKSRMSRTYKDETAPLGEYSKRLTTLQTQLNQVYKMKENLAYDSAYADFLKSLYVDTTNVFNFLEKYFNFSKTPASVILKDVKFSTQDKILIGDNVVIENNENAVLFTKYKLLNLKADADLSTLQYSQLSELREFLVFYNNFIEEIKVNNIKNSIVNLDKLADLNNLTGYVLDSLKDIDSALSVLNSKKLPDTIDELIEDTGIDTSIIPEDIMTALKSTDITNDVGMIEYLLGTTRDSSQPILRLINAIVKNIMHIAKRSTLNFANPFLEKLNHRIGQSMDWAYEKYKGNFTGYFISKHNYGEYYEEKTRFFKELNARYEYPEDFNARDNVFSEIITKYDSVSYYKDRITELKLKIFNESNEDLKLKYLDEIADNEVTIEKIEFDYTIYKQYRDESADWFNENTEPLDNIEQIIDELFNDDKITESEKTVWLSNNTLKNDSGDIISYTNELVRPSDKYLNYDYARLDNSQIADLEYIKQTKKDLDVYLPTKINNLAPQTYQSAIDTLMKTQLPELISKLKFLGKDVATRKEDDEIGELTGDIVDYQDETRIIKYNPTRYTRRLLEPNNISTDLLSSMIAYAKMVYEFKEKAERIEQLEFVAQNIKSGETLDTKKQESESTSGKNVMKQLENYLRVQIMGITYPDVTIPALNINITKLLKNAARFVTAKNLGLNFATQFVDNITSNIWYNIEKTMGDIVTRKSSKLGYSKFTELAQDAIKESKTTIKNNKLSVILRTLGLSDNLHSVFNDLDKNILMRDIGNKVLFAGYRASNFFISGNAALSALYNYRLYNGKWYTEKEFNKILNPTESYDSLPSAYENIRIENGVMSIDGMNTNTFNLFTRRLNNLISKIDGKLSEEDKTYAHSTLIGIVTLIHRDWILDGISRRFKKKGVNFDTNAVDEGYWRSTGKFMSDFFMNKEKIRNLKTLIENYNELDDSQKEGVRRTMYELLVVVGSITLAIIMNLGDDDDERDLDYLKDTMAYLSTRITMEMTAFYNPFEYVYAVSDVFVISRDFKKIISFTEMFNAKEIESGKWEGWTRSQKYFLQNVPGVTGAISLSNPEASNRFIINNVLGFAGGFDKFSYFSVPLIGSIDEEELKEIERDKR